MTKDSLARCARCHHVVGLRPDGTLRNHRGGGSEVLCPEAGKVGKAFTAGERDATTPHHKGQAVWVSPDTYARVAKFSQLCGVAISQIIDEALGLYFAGLQDTASSALSTPNGQRSAASR